MHDEYAVLHTLFWLPKDKFRVGEDLEFGHSAIQCIDRPGEKMSLDVPADLIGSCIYRALGIAISSMPE